MPRGYFNRRLIMMIAMIGSRCWLWCFSENGECYFDSQFTFTLIVTIEMESNFYFIILHFVWDDGNERERLGKK